ADGNEAGWVSSGTHCPYLGHAVCMGYIPADKAEPGTRYFADVRGRVIELEAVALPFYKIAR
ncbi:MAG: glycine cleavage system aminomethyltransferase GcvT, partial [Firmicutes bacterium]|nr:glycine cleavage system aminomethyltransferase GcvT [Bacillota bacterium]